jgi:TolB-like protein/Tfp pilus assembly protein PilF
LLIVFLRNSGIALDRAELIRAVWRDTAVEEGNLSQTIFVLRRALGDRPTDHRYIVTIPGIGYRFVADVEHDAEQGGASSAGEARPAGAVGLRSVAVLPFIGLAAAAGEEYLELGITDALITKLGGLRGMIVRPTTAVLKYHRHDRDRALAARELRVDAVLDGTIQRSGDRIRVAVHVNRADGVTLWAGRFDENLTDLFAVEDSIADQVARSLTLTLSAEDRRRLTKRSTENTDAYHAFLKGRFFWNKRSEEGLTRGIAFFEDAIELDPQYADAHAGLADSYNLLSAYGALSPKDGYPRARAAALRALEIDEQLAEAHTSLAYASLHFYWDWDSADRGFREAARLNANYPTAHQWYASYLTALGRFAEAMAEIRCALMLDPLSLMINADVGWHLYFARQHDAAIIQLQKTIEMDPSFAVAHWLIGLAYEQKGRTAQAIAAFERATSLSQDMPFALASTAHALARAGERERALATHARLVDLAARRYVSPYSIALVHAGLAEHDEAFRWLERACEERADRLVFLDVDPAFDPLRSDPRFDAIVDRIGVKRIREPVERETLPLRPAAPHARRADWSVHPNR